MKNYKISILLILFFLPLNVLATNIRWYGEYEKALNIAKNKSKNIMLFLIKKNSKVSKEMFLSTFKDTNLINKLNNNYISVIAIYENKTSYPLELFYTSYFPTIFFISYKDESFIYPPIYGYISSRKLSILLQ